MWRRDANRWTLAVLVSTVAMGLRAMHSEPFSPAVGGQPARSSAAVPAATLRQGTLSFDGHANVGDFVGRTSSATGAVLASADYASVRGWVEAPVATLKTGNGRRDGDLRKVMEVDRYPTMRYDLQGATVRSAAGADSASVVLHGTLRLHGVSRPVDVPATVVRSGDSARVTGTFPVNVTDYKVGGLRRLGGLLRMNEDIEVHLDLRFVVGR